MLIAITSSWNFPHPYRHSPFLFQDYQQIVNTAFLKVEMQKILSLSEHEASELQNANTESLDGLAFFPINSWPRGIRNLFHKSGIGDTDTFKFFLFAFGNNMSPHLLLNFLFIKYRKKPGIVPKRILQTKWFIHSIPENKTLMVLLRYYPIKISPFGWLPYPLKPLEHINISQLLPLFSLFQEPSTITKAIDEIFEVNADEDIEDMDLCDFTQDTSPTPALPKKPPVTFTILTTLPKVHSSTLHSSKHSSNDESITPKSINLTATTSQPTRTKPSTATLKRKGRTSNKIIPKLPRKLSPPPLMSLSFTPPTPQQQPQQTHMPSFTLPTIFSRTIAELLGIIPQIPREMTVRITFKGSFI